MNNDMAERLDWFGFGDKDNRTALTEAGGLIVPQLKPILGRFSAVVSANPAWSQHFQTKGLMDHARDA